MKQTLKQNFIAFIHDDSGPTAVEYAVMVALMIIVCIASIGLVGDNTNQLMDNAAKEMERINGN